VSNIRQFGPVCVQKRGWTQILFFGAFVALTPFLNGKEEREGKGRREGLVRFDWNLPFHLLLLGQGGLREAWREGGAGVVI